MGLLKDIISDLNTGKPQTTMPLVHVTQDFLKSAEDEDSRIGRELRLCRKHKIKIIVRYAEGLTPHELANAEKLLENIPRFTPSEA
jgi:hypothetical protein